MTMIKKIMFSIFGLAFYLSISAQPDRWQQRVEYSMDVEVDVTSHQMSGKQKIKYFNNSPDTLHRIFYHLYFNAFQPGSMMDEYNQDPLRADPRVKNRISELRPNEYGWHKVASLKCNGKETRYEVSETVLEVDLMEPILPLTSAILEMEFTSQIPIQIRRSGRDSKDGIAYSMSQWYPKLAEYDYQGWHTSPYVQREFHGVWGDFDVNITIDSKYVLGASGMLQNPSEIGHGYEAEGAIVKQSENGKLTWEWQARNVHDFAWSADPEYKHIKYLRKDGMEMHFLFDAKDEETMAKWTSMPKKMDRVFDFANKNYGQYPYKSYSFLHAGDGGMEYPMATFLASGAGIGTFIHELMHAWYYGMLASNESLYPWMDEGFTEYAEEEIKNFLRKEKLMDGNVVDDPHLGANSNYIKFIKSGREEVLSTHADHYLTAAAYGMASYTKGHVFLTQLQYIMGKPTFDKAFLRYFDIWKFKHPNPNDFIRIMEKEAGLELDWFKEYFVNTTKQIDYAIGSVERVNRKETKLTFERVGDMPMPIDLQITYKDGKVESYTIPLSIMRGAKNTDNYSENIGLLPDWRWTHKKYEWVLTAKTKNIVKVEIDPSLRMADVERENNVWEAAEN